MCQYQILPNFPNSTCILVLVLKLKEPALANYACELPWLSFYLVFPLTVFTCWRVWLVLAKLFGECHQAWWVSRISEKGHFVQMRVLAQNGYFFEYSHSLNSCTSSYCLVFPLTVFLLLHLFVLSFSSFSYFFKLENFTGSKLQGKRKLKLELKNTSHEETKSQAGTKLFFNSNFCSVQYFLF
jgi:hypothetical protein